MSDLHDYGFELTPIEAAAFARGTALPPEAYDVPDAPRDAKATATHWEKWARDNLLTATFFRTPIQEVVRPPFDGIPDRRSAAWWVAYCTDFLPTRTDGTALDWNELAQTSHEEIAWPNRMLQKGLKPAEKKVRAREAAADSDAPRPTQAWTGVWLPQGAQYAPWLALDGPEAAADLFDVEQLAAPRKNNRFRATAVPELRALVLPSLSQKTAAQVGTRLREIAADTDHEPVMRILASSLIVGAAETDEHTETHRGLLSEVGPSAFHFGANFHGDVLLAAALALPEPEERRDLAAGVLTDAGRGLDELPHTALTIGAFGPDVIEAWASRIGDYPAAMATLQARMLLGRLDGPAAVPVAQHLAEHSNAAKVAVDWLASHDHVKQ